jgi:hypothetical protein
MAKIALEAQVTQKEQAKLEKRLVKVNAQREKLAQQSASLPGIPNPIAYVPFATVAEWLNWEVAVRVEGILSEHNREVKATQDAALAAITPEQQAQIDAILGLT